MSSNEHLRLIQTTVHEIAGTSEICWMTVSLSFWPGKHPLIPMKHQISSHTKLCLWLLLLTSWILTTEGYKIIANTHTGVSGISRHGRLRSIFDESISRSSDWCARHIGWRWIRWQRCVARRCHSSSTASDVKYTMWWWPYIYDVSLGSQLASDDLHYTQHR